MTKEYINKLLQFDRGTLDEGGYTQGYVLDYTDDWTLLQVVERDMYFNGYSVIRNDTVIRYRELDDDDYLADRALKTLGFMPLKPEGIDLERVDSVALSVNDAFPILAVHRELRFKDSCEIGGIAKVTPKTIQLAAISPGAQYDRLFRIRSSEITMISFDGHYERALWAGASDETKQGITNQSSGRPKRGRG